MFTHWLSKSLSVNNKKMIITTFDRSYTVNKPFTSFTTYKTEFGKYIKGRYVCQTGFVLIYSDDRSSTFEYIRSGKIFSRTIHGKVFTERSLAVTAGKFARQVETMFK